MAIYHHVDDKQTLLALVVARVLSELPAVDRDHAWADRVREWAVAYWDLASVHREVIGAALADPRIARGALHAIEPVTGALAESGLDPALIQPTAFLIVDLVHGSALSGVAPERTDEARRWFEQGLEIVIAGITATGRR